MEGFMIQLLGALFAGIFFFNAIPHLVRGICGKRHMTPFSPSSSPAVNVVWSWINIVIGGLILKALPCETWTCSMYIAFCAGGFLTSVSLAIFWTNPEARLPWHKK